MEDLILSDAEKQFIINGVKQDIRIDGRSCFNYQNIEIETNLISNCFGSSHIRLGNCDIMAAVKVDLVDFENKNFDINNCDDSKGKIEFYVDLSANASPFFEGKGGQEIADLIISTLTTSYNQCFNFEKLCVLKNKFTWTVNVDILILEVGSKISLFDSCAIAVKAALLNTSIPKVTVDELNEITLVDDTQDVIRFYPNELPLFITLNRIGHRFIVDSTKEEEAASLASILFAVDFSGEIFHTKKITTGNLHSDALKEVFPKISELAKKLHEDVENKTNKQFKPNRLSGKFALDYNN